MKRYVNPEIVVKKLERTVDVLLTSGGAMSGGDLSDFNGVYDGTGIWI